MPDRPILFSAPMVRALLAGTKTQTRRVLNPQPETFTLESGAECLVYCEQTEGESVPRVAMGDGQCGVITLQKVPFAVGDRLWVKETHAFHWATDDQKSRDINPELWSVRYIADDFIRPASRDGSLATVDQCKKLRPSIFMPRWASRLTLTVTDVRVERLQSISEADAIAEGIYCTSLGLGGLYSIDRPGDKARGGATITRPAGWEKASHAYCHLWERINGKDSWEANPWVVAVSFDVRKGNIDA
jgi:hypothetical protein